MKTFLLNKVSRKAILASFLLASSAFASTVMAQTQDGRDFSIDGFAAYEGTQAPTGIVLAVLPEAQVARW